MTIKPYSRAKYNVARIAQPHPDHQEQIRWDIEGERLTSDEVIARCPKVKPSILKARLHSGVRKWALLAAAGNRTLRRLNVQRRKNAYASNRADAIALASRKLDHVRLSG